MRANQFFVAVATAASAVAAAAGPFGLNQGDTAEAISKLAPLKKGTQPGLYIAGSLPQGHQDLEAYWLVIAPGEGLCKINAWTPNKKTSVYGDEVQAEFKRWQEALTSKYGAPKKFDFLRVGSIWDEPRDWTMGLARKERTLAAFWEIPASEGGDVGSVKVQAVAVNSGNFMIGLTYELRNIEACLQSLTSKKNANL